METTVLEKNAPAPIEVVPWTIRQTIFGTLITLIPWMLFSLYLVSQGAKSASPVRLSPQLDLADSLFVLIFSSLIEAAFLLAPFYFAYRTTHATHATSSSAYRRSMLDVLGLRKFNVPMSLALVLLLFIAFIFINDIYSLLISAFHLHLQTNDQTILQESKNAPFSTYATLFVSIFVAPVCEEMFFRGFVFMGLLRAMPVWAAILLSSFLFAIAHVDLGSFAVLFIIGIALAFVRWRTRSLWPGVLLHLLNNAIGTILILLVMWGLTR